MRKLFQKIQNRIKIVSRRRKSRRTAYLYPEVQDGWKKQDHPVLGGNGQIYFDPFVREYDGKFHMLVSYRNEHMIVQTDSPDGIVWSECRCVLRGRTENDWDHMVNRGCMVVKDGRYYLWYTGQNNDIGSIGLAVSDDGLSFRRVSDAPVLKAEMPYEGVTVMNPCVMWDDRRSLFRMWYSAGENFEPDNLCYAESTDGEQWKRYSGNPIVTPGPQKWDSAKVGGCDVLYHNGRYLMYYIGYENIDNARICRAESSDGIHWIKDSVNPIISPGRNRWDDHAVYKPTVCIHGDQAYLWYNGRSHENEYIGLAEKSQIK